MQKEISRRVVSHARKLRARSARTEGRLRDQLEASEATRKATLASLDEAKRVKEADAVELSALRRALMRHEGESADSSHKANLDRAARLRLERLYARARHEATESKGEQANLQDRLVEITQKSVHDFFRPVCVRARNQ